MKYLKLCFIATLLSVVATAGAKAQYVLNYSTRYSPYGGYVTRFNYRNNGYYLRYAVSSTRGLLYYRSGYGYGGYGHGISGSYGRGGYGHNMYAGGYGRGGYGHGRY